MTAKPVRPRSKQARPTPVVAARWPWAPTAAFFYWIVASATGIIVDIVLMVTIWMYLAQPSKDGVNAGDIASAVVMLVFTLVSAAVLALPVFMARWARRAAHEQDAYQLWRGLTSLTVTSAIFWLAVVWGGLFAKDLFDAWVWAIPSLVVTAIGVVILGACWWHWRSLARGGR